MKKSPIPERLKKVEGSLQKAEQYVARNVNVESTSFCHFADWKGKSGHPLWMKNHAIPTMKRALARFEKRLDQIAAREKDRRLQRRTPRTYP
jgi:hypothetical protein